MIQDSSKNNLICPKHNLELQYQHPDQFSTQGFACFECVKEFHRLIPIEKIIESNQALIQDIESQLISNSIIMNLLIHTLRWLRETIHKKIEILITDISNQIKINEEGKQYVKNNVLSKQEISQFHNKVLEDQRLFQKKAIQQIESLQKHFDINIEAMNQIQIKQNTEGIKRYEYQLQEQSSMEYSISCKAIAFNKDASIILAGYDYDIKVFEFKDERLKEIQLLKSSQNSITTCLQFTKKRNQFIQGSSDNKINIWQQDKKSKWINVETLVGHENSVFCLTINENEDLLISGGRDKQIIVWRLNNKKWSNDQTIKCIDYVYSLSLNNTNTKLVSSDNSGMIQVLGYKGNKWEIIQKINTDKHGFRICFISDDDFVFLPKCSEYLYFYNFNQTCKQFQQVDKLQIKNNHIDQDGFPIQFISSKKLLIVKNGKFVNILRKQENDKFILNQSIEFEDYYMFGSVSDDGQFLITWNYKTQKLEFRKFVQIL